MLKKRRQIKLLLTIPNFDTAGTGSHMFEIAQALDKSVFDVHIMCEHDKGDFYKTVSASSIPVHVFDYKTSMQNKASGMMQVMKKVISFKKHQFDVVHSWNYSNDYSEALLSKLSGSKWIFLKKNMNWGGPSANSWKLRTRLANHIVTLNKQMNELFFKKQHNVSLVPHGVDTKRFSLQMKDNAFMQTFGIQSNDVVMLAVANLVPLKKIEFLIDAFEVLSIKKTNLKLIIVGHQFGEYGTFIKTKVADSPVANNIILVEHREDVERFYNMADLFLMCSEKEGFPLTMLEAMSSGVIPVANDIAAIQDQLQNFPQLIYPTSELNAFVQKIEEVMAMSSEQQLALKNALRQNTIANYSLEREVRDYELIYQQVFLA
jgi:glycosyltransferase involved in cell wall biosynthesis